MVVRIILVLCILLLSSCIKNPFKKYRPDNYTEELVERIIENRTGADIDLTPASVEKS